NLHPVLLKQGAEFVEGQHFVNGWSAAILSDLPEELFHAARRLVNVQNPGGPAVCRHPSMNGLARDKNALTGGGGELPLADNEQQLAIDDINPLVLIVVPPPRAGAGSGELEDTQGAARISPGHLAINRLARQLYSLIEARLAGSNPET